MTETPLPLAGDYLLPQRAVARIPWQTVRALNGLAAGEGATRAHAFHAALALVLRRFTGNDELIVHLEDSAAGGVRTLIKDTMSFREAICIVRTACDEMERFIISSGDSLCVRVAGAYGCELRGDVTGDVLTLTLRSEERLLPSEGTQSVLDALVAVIEAVILAPDRAGNELPQTSRDMRELLRWRSDGPRRPRVNATRVNRIVVARRMA